MRQVFRGTRYANVTSTLALVVALGGTGAYAANTIGSKDIRNGQVKGADLGRDAVTSAKVKNRSLRAADFGEGALPAGPKGTQGDTGVTGAAGPPGPLLDVLPSGRSLRGSYSFSGYYSGGTVAAQYDTAPADGQISFQLPLASKPVVEIVAKDEPPTATCPGSVANPLASAGRLCVYESAISNND
ncbi:MAG: hypothetical protein ACRDKY_12720, partial [Solirubrobacteraceae bacterium]